MNITSLTSSVALACAATLLAGCASFNSVTSDVASYGDWPADRKPASYAFERLPSQTADPQARARADAVEAAAGKALGKAGFTPSAAGATPDVLVQAGHRVSRADRGPWTDPLWWRGSFGYYRYGPWIGPSWGLHYRHEPQRYESEVALLLRDRASGKPLFETRASSDGSARGDPAMLTAMFEAALVDFPKTGINPRRVTVAAPGP